MQRAVWPESIILLSLLFNRRLCFFQEIEDRSIGHAPMNRPAMLSFVLDVPGTRFKVQSQITNQNITRQNAMHVKS